MQTKPVEVLLKEKKIYEIVNPRLVQAPPEISVAEAVRLMQEKKSGYIVIAKKNKVAGIFTEVDVAIKLLNYEMDWTKAVSEYMTPDPVILKLTDSVGMAIDLMGNGNFYHIPLVDEQANLVNVLSVRTLIRFLAAFYPTEIYNLPPKFDQIMETQEGG